MHGVVINVSRDALSDVIDGRIVLNDTASCLLFGLQRHLSQVARSKSSRVKVLRFALRVDERV